MILYLCLTFGVLVGIQSIYFVLYAIAIAKYKNNPPEETKGISVVVCARNEIDNLKKNLPLLLEQDYPDFEVVVVNDRSVDGTYEYLHDLKGNHPRFKMVQVDHVPDHINSKKYAITLGIKAAKNEDVLFTDADCAPQGNQWVASMASRYTNPKHQIVLGVSLYEKKKGLLNLFIRFETWFTALQYVGSALLRNPYMGVGRNLAYKKSLFINNKGFFGIQEITGGDDDLFVNKHANNKNVGVQLGKEALVYSTPKATWGAFFIQKIRHLSVGKKYRAKHKIILGLFTLTHLLFWVALIPMAIYEPYWAIAGFSTRLLLMIVLFYVGSKKIGETFVPFILPVLDIVYVIYYISVGTIAAFSKNIRWS